jgi:hypothetical protein
MKRTTGDKIPADEMLAYETRFYQRGLCRSIAGVDEAGRGPLGRAGQRGGGDSRSGPAHRRAHRFQETEAQPARGAVCRNLRKANVAVAFVPVEVIERINIRKASLLAMRKAIAALSGPARSGAGRRAGCAAGAGHARRGRSSAGTGKVRLDCRCVDRRQGAARPADGAGEHRPFRAMALKNMQDMARPSTARRSLSSAPAPSPAEFRTVQERDTIKFYRLTPFSS